MTVVDARALRPTNRSKAMAAHDGTNGIIEGVQEVADTPRRGKLHTPKFDFNKPLIWDDPGEAAEQYDFLTKHSPLHSVVIRISPKVAAMLLERSNVRNRPKTKNHAGRLSAEMLAASFELTGDTLKVSKEGILLDGQHRLEGSVLAKKPLTTHCVFGLEDAVFDVLDQGKKRSPGDVLALCGIADHTMVAGAIVWALKFQKGGSFDNGQVANSTTARQIRALATGKMKAIGEHVRDARLINTAYKHPPTMVAGLLYIIGQRDMGLARDFAHEWVHGAKIGRNKNFDVLNQRLVTIAHQNGGNVNRNVRAALIIQAFNYWNAHLVASPRALTWKKGWTFPTLEFDKDRFVKAKELQDRENTSLSAVKHRVLKALSKNVDAGQRVQMSLNEIATAANVSRNSVPYILSELKTSKQVALVKATSDNKPAIYRVLVPAAEIVAPT